MGAAFLFPSEVVVKEVLIVGYERLFVGRPGFIVAHFLGKGGQVYFVFLDLLS